MATKDKDVIRWALLSALKWEESLLESYRGATGPEAEHMRSRTARRIVQFQNLLDRRYGGVPPDPMSGAKSIDVRDIKPTQE